jgi:hypothetical protein
MRALAEDIDFLMSIAGLLKVFLLHAEKSSTN